MCYLPDARPPTILFAVTHSHLLFLAPSSSDVEPLFVLEFLHRLGDILEDFLGAPLLASKIENAYDVVAQLLGEMCDAGSVCQTEPNALRDVVSMPGWIDKLLGGVGLPGTPPALGTPGGAGSGGGLKAQLGLTAPNAGPAIPWRRANVRHTSNELYVDIVETLRVTLAPSGRPLAALASGSVVFTSKISGVPDLLLTLSVPGGRQAVGRVIEAPTFHPCVRLARWRERPGELSFVPPDGKFLLASYNVDLLPNPDILSNNAKNLNLPVLVEVDTSLGPVGLDFEVRLVFSTLFASNPASGLGSASSGRPALSAVGSRSGSGRSTPSFFGPPAGSSAGPTLSEVTVTVPMPPGVRNMAELRASRGEASFAAADQMVEWHLSNREVADAAGTATLRATVVGPLGGEASDAALGRFDAGNGNYYDEAVDGYQIGEEEVPKKQPAKEREPGPERDSRKVEQNRTLMPTSAAVSFSVKGWLASGMRVESLVVDTRKSKGLGEGVKPIKGVKYITVSRKGVETRC